MAVPPTYADLGKSAKDIFNKGYGNVSNNLLHHVENHHLLSLHVVIFHLVCFLKGFGMVKLDVKTKSASGVVRFSFIIYVTVSSLVFDWKHISQFHVHYKY